MESVEGRGAWSISCVKHGFFLDYDGFTGS